MVASAGGRSTIEEHCACVKGLLVNRSFEKIRKLKVDLATFDLLSGYCTRVSISLTLARIHRVRWLFTLELPSLRLSLDLGKAVSYSRS